MPENTEVAARMFQARTALHARMGRAVSLEELGAMVARAAGRKEPFAPSVVGRWLNGQQEPRSIELWAALAKALGAEPGFLAFGEQPALSGELSATVTRAGGGTIPSGDHTARRMDGPATGTGARRKPA